MGEAAMMLADEHERVHRAACEETGAGALEALANDNSVLVRSAVALNLAAPGAANLVLARDGDERVRLVLTRKISTMLPAAPGATHGAMAAEAWTVLRVLARDEAVRVRMEVAEVLKAVPGVPRDVILTLARDPEFLVSDPVLRLSPALSEVDLLALIGRPPTAHARRSIAGREGLGEAACDAIAASADDGAIRAMLENGSAAVREATLDRLVAEAAPRVAWHAPLARRPALSARSAVLLAGFVAEDVLGELAGRADLPRGVVALVRGRIAARSWSEPAPTPRGRDESALIDALRHAELELVATLLADACAVSPEAVERAARARNAKAAVALLWKAGFTMRPAAALEALLFAVPPAEVLRAAPGGGFPLSEAEMRLQLTLLDKSLFASFSSEKEDPCALA